MPGIEDIPGWFTGGAGVTLLYITYKFFWPSIRDSLSGQASQWRSENRYITQLEQARDRAFAQRDAAVQKYDDLYQRFARMEAQMQIMEHKLDQAYTEIQKLTGALNARNN